MPKTLVASLCLTIALILSLSDTAWSQSATPPAISPVALALQQQIRAKQSLRETLTHQLSRITKAREDMTKQIAGADNRLQAAGVSVESFPGILESLQSKRIDLMIDLAGLTAKRQAILAAQEIAEDMPDSPTKNKTILADSLLETSLALAEKKARLESVKSFLPKVLTSRSVLNAAKDLKTKSYNIATQENKITNDLIKNTSELKFLKYQLKGLRGQ